MKKFLIALLLIVGLVFSIQPAEAVTISLRANWTPPPESDLAGYFLKLESPYNSNIWKYYIAGTPNWTDTKPGTRIPFGTTQLDFQLTIPDSPTTGKLQFAIAAVDTNGNVGQWRGCEYVFNVDVSPPSIVSSFTVTKP